MTEPNEEVMAALQRMFYARQARRDARTDTAWRTMTRHERRIYREAAVMGYVLGYRSGNLDGRTGKGGPLDRENRTPHDQDIVAIVIQHCDTTSDLYPYTAALCNGRRRRITRKRLYPGEDNHR